ncbi:hypothetical protein GCM10028790_42690 [Micromonospora taraxaci]
MDSEAAEQNADDEDGDEPQNHFLFGYGVVMGSGIRLRRLMIALVQVDHCMLHDMGVSLESLRIRARRPVVQPNPPADAIGQRRPAVRDLLLILRPPAFLVCPG